MISYLNNNLNNNLNKVIISYLNNNLNIKLKRDGRKKDIKLYTLTDPRTLYSRKRNPSISMKLQNDTRYNS